MADLSMTFINQTDVEFTLAQSESSLSVLDDIAQSPVPVLKANSSTTFSVDNQSIIGEGAAEFYCVWYDPTGDGKYTIRFGVKISDGGQPFGIGPQPTWLIMYDRGLNPNSPVSWDPSGNDPSIVYNWPTDEWPYTIKGSPVSGHETLNIEIVINPKS